MEAGGTVNRLAEKVNELLDAKKTLYYTNVVLDSKEVPDTTAQVQALHIASRVHGIDKGEIEELQEVLTVQLAAC
jgi:hypothetical protein